MLWQIVNIVDLPYGKRVLRRGMRGKAVRKLQELLAEHGFYSESVDGEFGVLTEEAVMLLQKTFRITVDGVAGPSVYHALQRMNNKVGRIIYTVKPGENLTDISQRFNVNPAAWRRMPDGRGDLKKIYPGMKLWLYRKAFFTWEEENEANPVIGNITGRINSGLQVDIEAELNFEGDPLKRDGYCLIRIAGEVWEQGFASKKYFQKVAANLRKLKGYKWGLDLRSAPFAGYPNWNGFFKLLLKSNGLEKIPLVLVPLFISQKGVKKGFWDNLAAIGAYARLIMVEPLLDNTSVEAFSAAVCQLERLWSRFARLGAVRQLLLVVSPQGWSWDEANNFRQVGWKEIKLIRAMHSRGAEEVLPIGLRRINYLSQGKGQCLIYRDYAAWQELMARMLKANFSGIVIRNFKELGTMGPELIAGSFAVLPMELL